MDTAKLHNHPYFDIRPSYFNFSMLTKDHIKLSETNLQGAKSTVNMQIISKDREDHFDKFGKFGNVCPTNVDRRR